MSTPNAQSVPGISQRLAILFPLALWFVGTFFLLGMWGKWNDDWFYLQRDPVTGGIESLILNREVHFWRPLARVMLPGMQTLLWQQDAVHHAIGAVVHGVNAILVYGLLARIGARRLGGSIGSLLFLTYPWQYEIPLWNTTLPTSAATGMVLGAVLIGLRERVGFLALSTIAGLVFGAAALNEQPTMLIAGMPLLRLVRVRGERVRACVPAVAGAVGIAVYLGAQFLVMKAPLAQGREMGVSPAAHLLGTIKGVLQGIARDCVSGDRAGRAVRLGIEAMREHPVLAVVCGVGAAIGVWGWVRMHAQRGGERLEPNGPARPSLVSAAGLVLIAAPFLPIIAFNYWLSPRILYPSSVGVAVLIAGLDALIGRRTGGRAAARAVVAGVFAAVFVVSAVMLVGAQRAYRVQDELDERALKSLAAIAGPVAEGAVFVPVRTEGPQTGAATRYDGRFLSVFCSPWSAGNAVRGHVHRKDVPCGYADWGMAAWRNAAFDGCLVQGAGRFAWDRLIPFTVDRAGRVEVVTHARYVNAGGEAIELALARTAPMIEQGKAERRVMDVAGPKRGGP